MSKYNVFVESADMFIPQKVDGTSKTLPTGAYSPRWNRDYDRAEFHKIKISSDDIIDLPSKEYDYVLGQMKHFLQPATKEAYTREGFIYKRSVLLHGQPGTGKTVIVNRVVQEALKNEAIVLFNPDPSYMGEFYDALEATAPDKLTLVIFEEFDGLAQSHEEELLSVLDGEVQKNNVIYLATTNHLDRISMRMQRPGRFSSIVEVGFPTEVARSTYLKAKRVNESDLKKWVAISDGFSIDELKETVLAVKCLGEKLETVVDRIKNLKDRGLESESRKTEESLEKKKALQAMTRMLDPFSYEISGKTAVPRIR